MSGDGNSKCYFDPACHSELGVLLEGTGLHGVFAQRGLFLSIRLVKLLNNWLESLVLHVSALEFNIAYTSNIVCMKDLYAWKIFDIASSNNKSLLIEFHNQHKCNCFYFFKSGLSGCTSGCVLLNASNFNSSL